MPLPPALARRLAEVPVEVTDPGLFWAAVAVIIAPDPDSLLLIRRAHREGDPWSGHMALPGGRSQTEDRDLLDTAIRETHEEVGVVLARDQLAGVLDDVAPRTPVLPPIAVRPFVFFLPVRPDLSLNAEVADAEWVALSALQRPDARRMIEVAVSNGSRTVPAYVTGHGVVWGMTERILSLLFDHPPHND